jgi:hypothetical protein
MMVIRMHRKNIDDRQTDIHAFARMMVIQACCENMDDTQMK